MATIQELLASILNPNPGMSVNQLTGPSSLDGPNYLTQTGLGPEQLARYHQMSGMGGGAMPQAASPAPVAAPQPQMPDQMQTASAGYPSQAGGGFLSGLLGGGGGGGENQTIQWLQGQGIDPGTATMMAKHKPALQAYLLKRSQGAEPIEINGRLVDPNTYEVLADFSDKGESGRPIPVGQDSALYDPATKAWITPPNAGGGGLFEGNSVEAQSLNGLVQRGILTEQMAMEVGAGKVITNPADGSIMFMTPQGLAGAPAGGGQPQLIAPNAGAPAPAPAPGEAAPSPGPSAAPATVPGARTLTDGKPGKLQTEAERRNQSLYHVAAPDMKRALDNFSSLENVWHQAASKTLPWGLDNAATSPEFQRASNAMRNIIATYLYSTSGATANPGEVENNFNVLMPKPFEDPASVADKKARLQDMVEAIRLAGGESAARPPRSDATPEQLQAMPPPAGIEPGVWKFMKPEDRKLWLD